MRSVSHKVSNQVSASCSHERPLLATVRHVLAAVWLLVAQLLMVCDRAAANVEKDVLTTATDLASGSSYLGGGTPGIAWDATFTSAIYNVTTFTLGANLSVGTLNDLDATQALTIANNGSAARILTLSGGVNTVPGSAAADLIYVAANGSLTIRNGTQTLTLALAANGNFDTAAGASLTISSAITGSNFLLTKSGAGVLTLSGANTFGGGGRAFTLAGGTLNINSAAALGNTGNIFTINGGTTIDNTSGAAITTGNYGVSINGDFTFAGGGIGTAHDLNLGTGNATLGTAAGTSRTITVAAANSTLTLGGTLANGTTANSLIKAGAGTLLLSGKNTYSGSTMVNGGTLRAGNAQAFGANSAVTVNAGGTLDLGGNSLTIGSLAGAAGGFVQNTGAAATLTTGGLNTSTTFAGTLQNGTGVLSLLKTGTGNLTLSGNNAHSGTTTLQTGTLTIGSDTALGTGTLLFNGGTLAATGGARTLANAVQFTKRNLAFNSTSDLTINGAVTETTSIRMTVGGTGVLTLGGVVSGNGRYLRKLGTGTMALNAANTFTGGLDLRAGTTVVGNNAAAGTGTLTLRGGAIQAGGAARTLANTVLLNGNTTFSGANNLSFTGAASLQNSFTLTVQNPDTTFAGVISGGGSVLSKAGTGTLTLGGANTFSGGLVIQNGIVVLDSNGAAGTGTITVGDVLTTSTAPASLLFSGTSGRTVSNAIIVPAGSTGLRTIGGLNTTGVNTFSGALTLGTGFTLAQGTGGEVNFTGLVSGAGGITKTGAGTIRIGKSGVANTFAGATLVSAGTLAFSASNAIGTGTVTVNGGSLDLGANLTDTVGAVTLQSGSILGTGTATLTSTSGFTVRAGTVTAILAGAVGLTKDTAGTVILSGANTYGGTTSVNAGTLAFGASNVIGPGALIVSGGTIDMGTGRTDSVGAVTLTSGSILGGAGSVLTSTSGFTLQSGTVTAALGGAVAVTKNTAGTVLISGANTYTGATTVSTGTLRLGANEPLPNASAVTISAGATLDLNDFNDTIASLSGAGNVLLGAGRLTTGGNNTSTTFTGTIGGNFGSGGLTKTGTGVFTIGGSNLYFGSTEVNAGTLTLGSSLSAPATSRVNVAAGATFNVAGFTTAIGSFAGAGSVTLGAGTLTAGGDNTSSTFSGVVSGTGGLTKAGTGTLTMTGVNTFTGSISVNGGNLVLAGTAGTAAAVSNVSIRTGGSLVLDNSAGENLNRIGNTAAINIQGGDLKLISDANGTTETVGVLSFLVGPANVTVVHNGTATQSSALTFSAIGGLVTGTTLNFAGTGGTLGAGLYGPHIYITGQANGLIGGWARVGSDFAEYQADGVRAYSAYYTGSAGINVNDPAKIVQLSSASPLGAYTLTNAGTTTDGGLQLTNLALVDLNTASTRTLNLSGGGLIKKSAPDTTISGAGRLTAGGTAAGALFVSVETARTLTIASSIINNAGTDGIYGNAGDGVVSIVKSDFGTLVLSGVNTFSGGLHLNEGTVAVASDASLGAVAGGIFLSGGTLAITGTFTAGSARQFTLTAGLTSTIDVAAAQTLTVGGTNQLLAGASGQLNKSGTGTLVLAGANAGFVGTLQLAAGTVELRNTASLGTGSVALAGGTLRLRADANTVFGNAISLLANSSIAASPLTTGAPLLSLGNLSLGAQTLSLDSSGGATLGFSAASLAGNATFNVTAGTTTVGTVSGAYGFAKTGTGILQLTGPGTYTGATNVQGGTLRLANPAGITLASAVNIGAAGTVDLNSLSATLGSLTGTGSLTLGSGTLTVGGNGLASSFGGVISGTGGIVKVAGETFALSGANSYRGATIIAGGELLLGAADALPATTSVTIAAGASLNLAGYSQTVAVVTGAGTLAIGSGTLTVGDSTSFAFGGDITGTGSIRKIGNGTWSLSGDSAFTGALIVAGGTILVLDDRALGDSLVMAGAQIVLAPGVTVNTGPLSLAGMGSAGAGALRVDSGAAGWAGPVQFTADATTGSAAGTTLTLNGGIDLSGRTMTVSGAGNTVSTGAISGTGTLQKTDAGTLTLSGASSFKGRIVVMAGALNVGSDTALGAAGTGNETDVRSGASLIFSGAVGIDIHSESLFLAGIGVGGAGALQSLSGENVSEGAILLTGDTSVTVASASTLSMVGGIGETSPGKNLTKNGPGLFVLGGTNTFTGTLAVNDGTLQIAGDHTFDGNPGLSLAATATLDLNDFSDTLGSLSGAGTITFGTELTGGGTLAIGANGSSSNFTGTITGVGDLEKTGSGSLTLAGANTYTGNTILSDGTLVAGNNLAFGTPGPDQTIAFNGGALASNNDARVLAHPMVVNPVEGNRITGSNSIAFTGPVTGGGAGSVLDINLTNPAKTVTVNPSAAGGFNPGTVRLTSGTLLFGGANKIPATTDIIMNGGKLETGGYSDNLGAMILAADSSMDFGTSNNVRLQFSSASWTGGTLNVTNWTGTAATANNPDQFLIGPGPVSENFLRNISFQGFGPGAIAFDRGGGVYEVVPIPEPTTIFGALAVVAFIGYRERRTVRRWTSRGQNPRKP